MVPLLQRMLQRMLQRLACLTRPSALKKKQQQKTGQTQGAPSLLEKNFSQPPPPSSPRSQASSSRSSMKGNTALPRRQRRRRTRRSYCSPRGRRGCRRSCGSRCRSTREKRRSDGRSSRRQPQICSQEVELVLRHHWSKKQKKKGPRWPGLGRCRDSTAWRSRPRFRLQLAPESFLSPSRRPSLLHLLAETMTTLSLPLASAAACARTDSAGRFLSSCPSLPSRSPLLMRLSIATPRTKEAVVAMPFHQLVQPRWSCGRNSPPRRGPMPRRPSFSLSATFRSSSQLFCKIEHISVSAIAPTISRVNFKARASELTLLDEKERDNLPTIDLDEAADFPLS